MNDVETVFACRLVYRGLRGTIAYAIYRYGVSIYLAIIRRIKLEQFGYNGYSDLPTININFPSVILCKLVRFVHLNTKNARKLYFDK